MSKRRPSSKPSESQVVADVRLLSRGSVRLMRNNVGQLIDSRGTVVKYGLGVGSSDLIGFRTLIIEPSMVGQQIAQFVALEVKAPDVWTEPGHQDAFLRVVRESGGVGEFVRSVEDAEAALAAPVGQRPVLATREDRE